MILPIILLVVILLLLALIIMFLFYVLYPSINKDGLKNDDPFLSNREINNIQTENQEVTLTPSKAYVLCNCNKSFQKDRIVFNQLHTCAMVNSKYGTGTDCKFACIGLGDCEKICPQQAIFIENNTAKVSSLCIGCGKCAEVCPLHIIKLIPTDTKIISVCSNQNLENRTSCSNRDGEEKVLWNDKKDFKMWKYCYKMYKTITKILFK